MDAVLISGERLLFPLCLPSNDNTDVLNILTYSFPAGKCSLSPSHPSVSPPWPVSASSQQSAVRGLPLFLYNLNCQMALWDSRWVKKSSRIKELGKGQVGLSLAGWLWQSSTLAAGHCRARRWPLGSHHRALPTPAPRPGSCCRRRLPQGITEKPEG